MTKVHRQLLSIPYLDKGFRLDDMFVPMKIPALLPVPDTVMVDEYSFISVTDEQKRHMSQNNRLQRTGYGYQCRSLCRFYPKIRNSRQISFKRTGHYYCATCEIAMKCLRCRCCSRMGRAEPKGRSRRLDKPDVKFID